MSKYLNHSERITSYLEDQMSPGQMQEFEKQLHTDPVLRSEFELQKDIIHSIRDYRKTQLKSRLDQVSVGMEPGMLVGVKAAAALVISGIIGVGTYLYFTAPEEAESITEIVTPVDQLKVPQETLSNLPQELPVNEEEFITPEVMEEEAGSAEAGETNSVAALEKAPAEKPLESRPADNNDAEQANPVINSPNVIEPSLDHTEVEESIEIPTAALAQDGLLENKVVAVETAKKDSDMFHYQYYSGKLYLYGDFRDNPYEILELNSANGKRLFIYYNGAYYRILDDQQEITPLEILTDQSIIKKLEIIQANK